jgi:hypothetical protein
MLRLADIQTALGQAMLTGDPSLAGDTLVGSYDRNTRLQIHLRHYASSLKAALDDKFPATRWLLGSALFADATAAYIRSHPPLTPCIAEYGSDFPTFVGHFERIAALPYVESFASLEWAVGRASIAVGMNPIEWHEIASVGSSALLDARLRLQPGLTYLLAAHDVDTLMRVYLSDREPATFLMPRGDAPIEIRGSRGSFGMARLDLATFTFREALRAGDSIGRAAGRALETDAGFDAGSALRALVGGGLVVAAVL